MNDNTENKPYAAATVTPKRGSEVEITGEVSVEVVHRHRMKALKRYMQALELPGFRKGHVPEDMALKHVGELALMQDAAETAIGEAYAAIVEDHALDVVGRPNVTVTKLAPGNPIGFKIESAVYPEVTLPDYQKLAADARAKADDPEKVTVSDGEVEGELKRLQEMMMNIDKGEKTKEDKTKVIDNAGAENGHAMVEIDDAFARSLGDFKDLADLKDKIKTGMQMDKKAKTQDKRRLAVLEAVLEKTKVEVPALFVEGEMEQMFAEFESRVTRAGMGLDDYLVQAKKSKEDLRKEWHPDAEKRAKLQLTLTAIAKKEGITPDQAKLDREVAHLTEHYPDADRETVRVYAHAQLTNNLVFALLEGRAKDEVEAVEHDHTH